MKKRVISLLAALALLLTLLPASALPVLAEDADIVTGRCGDELQWALNLSTWGLEITGSGAMYNYSEEQPPEWDEYKEQILSVSLPEGLENIGDCAFRSCTALTGARLPESLRYIGKKAFAGCAGLRSCYLPDRVEYIDDSCFADCGALEEIRLSPAMQVMGAGAFQNCTALCAVDIPEGVSEIRQYCFSDCESLETVTLPPLLERIWIGAFARCASLTELELPYGLWRIGQAAFMGCEALRSVSLPDTLQEIGESAFAFCSSLQELRIPGGVCELKSLIFDAPSLQTLTILQPGCSLDDSFIDAVEGLTIRGWSDSTAQRYAEEHGIAFEPLELPAGVCGEQGDGLSWSLDPQSGFLNIQGDGRMRDYDEESPAPWSEWNSLITTIEFPWKLEYIGDSAFFRCPWVYDLYIPPQVSEIGDDAFFQCLSISTIGFHAGVQTIGLRAFAGCRELIAVVLPEGTEYIRDYAFSGCPYLDYLSLPNSLRFLGRGVFSEDVSLTGVTVPGLVEQIDSLAFQGCEGLNALYILNPDCQLEEEIVTPSEALTIYGWEPSTAKSYAEANEIAFAPISELSGSCGAEGDELRWRFDPFSGALTIEGSGAMADYNDITAPWACFNSRIFSLSLPEGLTRIGHCAFGGCTGLTELVLPNSLSAIGEQAFYACTGLNSLSIPGAVEELGSTCFAYCDALHSAVLSEGVPYIPDSMFWGCKSLNSVSIPNTAASIGEYAFYLSGLHSVTIPASVRRIEANAFQRCSALDTIIFRSADCLISSGTALPSWMEAGDEFEAYAETLGSCEHTLIYGVHDQEKLDAEPVLESEERYHYVEAYAALYGYSFLATNSFGDVPAGKYYEIPVAWACGQGITSGTGDGQFSPGKTCTREQVMTFLYAAKAKPGHAETESPFTDVTRGKYYYHPVMWAVENRITGGVSSTLFGVGKPCTREQVVAFLWKAAGSPEPEQTESPFTDVLPGKYYFKAVLWALENGVTGGTSETSFGVGKPCTRAQVVTFLYKAQGE